MVSLYYWVINIYNIGTIAVIVSMHIIFKIIEEGQKIISIILKNVKLGYFPAKFNLFKKLDVRLEWNAINVMDGCNRDFILKYT